MSDPVSIGPSAVTPSQTRIVTSDDGFKIRLSIYPAGVAEPLAVAELSPEAAIHLVAELSGAAARHIARQRNHRIGVQRGPP